jgi:hypothetical protein
MGIERLNEADAPEVAREQVGDQGDANGDRVVAPETRDQRTCRTEYRATVEAEYGAAPDSSWDTAVLELRKAWAAHEAKWPPPRDSRSSHAPAAPGAWRGDSDRYLDPDANAEVDHGCGRIREVAENVITPAIRAIEAEDLNRHLIGLEYSLKSVDRIKEKVADAVRYKGRTAEEALATVKDAIRFTFCYSEEGYTSGVLEDCVRLQDRGLQPFDRVSSWEAEEYKGVNSRWREPESGLLFEVQFHTRASFEAKQITHAAYERLRSPATSDNERDELQEFQRKVSAAIPIPPGATDIEDYSPEERNG